MKITATKLTLELELSEAVALKTLLGALSIKDYEELMGKNADEIAPNRRLFKELSGFFEGVL